MSVQKFKITSLTPTVLNDRRRTMLELVIDGLPERTGGFCGIDSGPVNVDFFPELNLAPASPPTPAATPPATEDVAYPDVELSILNSRRQQVASMLIVQHREAVISMTLHIPRPDAQEQYIARAEMVHNDELIDVVEVPFTLNQTA